MMARSYVAMLTNLDCFAQKNEDTTRFSGAEFQLRPNETERKIG